MRLVTRRNVALVLAVGITGAILSLPAAYFLGLWLAPPRPVAVSQRVPPLLGEAIWASVEGGRATALEPFNPFRAARMGVCLGLANRVEDTSERRHRETECHRILPALQGAVDLATVHMQDNGVPHDPRYPFAQIATVTWLTRTFSRSELVDTLAARAPFRFGFRGIESAAHGFFGRPAAELTLPQAALLAVLLRDLHLDPWCDLSGAGLRRLRLLERMRDNLAIDDTSLERANAAELGLTSPPSNHRGCE